MKEVHISEVKSYMRCRLSWYWSWVKNLEPIVPRSALFMGRAFHIAAQAWYDDPSGTPMKDAFMQAAGDEIDSARTLMLPADIDQLHEDVELGVSMCNMYQRWAKRGDKGVRWLATEYTYHTPLPTKLNAFMAGRFDGIVEKDDGLWVMEFKTTKSNNVSWVPTDPQGLCYVWAARQKFGPDVRGLLYRFVRKRVPVTWEDLILKSGGLTSNKRTLEKTTLEDFQDALAVAVIDEMGHTDSPAEAHLLFEAMRAGAKPSWMPDFLNRLSYAHRAYAGTLEELRHARTYVWEQEERRSEKQIDRFLRFTLYPIVKEMKRGPWVGPTGKGAAYAVCPRCSFKGPCDAFIAGENAKEILEAEYRPRKKDYAGEGKEAKL